MKRIYCYESESIDIRPSYGSHINDEKYLIESIWMDPMEKRDAHGYKPLAYADTEAEAKDFCAKGRMYTKADCWSIYGEMPQYRYEKILNVYALSDAEKIEIELRILKKQEELLEYQIKQERLKAELLELEAVKAQDNERERKRARSERLTVEGREEA